MRSTDSCVVRKKILFQERKEGRKEGAMVVLSRVAETVYIH